MLLIVRKGKLIRQRRRDYFIIEIAVTLSSLIVTVVDRNVFNELEKVRAHE